MAFSYTRDKITFMNKKAYSLLLLVALLASCKSGVLPLEHKAYSYLEEVKETFVQTRSEEHTSELQSRE